jgi:hypothetical protein
MIIAATIKLAVKYFIISLLRTRREALIELHPARSRHQQPAAAFQPNHGKFAVLVGNGDRGGESDEGNLGRRPTRGAVLARVESPDSAAVGDLDGRGENAPPARGISSVSNSPSPSSPSGVASALSAPSPASLPSASPTAASYASAEASAKLAS